MTQSTLINCLAVALWPQFLCIPVKTKMNKADQKSINMFGTVLIHPPLTKFPKREDRWECQYYVYMQYHHDALIFSWKIWEFSWIKAWLWAMYVKTIQIFQLIMLQMRTCSVEAVKKSFLCNYCNTGHVNQIKNEHIHMYLYKVCYYVSHQNILFRTDHVRL